MKARLLAVLGLSLILPATAPAQRSYSTGGGMISASARSSTVSHRLPSDSTVLDLAIIWRASPGVFSFPNSTGSSSSNGYRFTGHQSFSHGGIDFSIDTALRTLVIGGKDFPLNGANLVLVDVTDSLGNFNVVAMKSVARVWAAMFPVYAAIRESEELYRFMRCDVPSISTDARVRGAENGTCISLKPGSPDIDGLTSPPPPKPIFSYSYGSRIVSPTVFATSILQYRRGSDTAQVELVILWRGSPGWHLKGSPSGGSGGGQMGGVQTEHLRQGGLEFDYSFNPATRNATVMGISVDANATDVILVDSIDAPAGHQVITRLSADRKIYDPGYTRWSHAGTGPDSIPEIERTRDIFPFLARSPEIVRLLQCDMPVPQAPPGFMDLLCAQVVPAPHLAIDSIFVERTTANGTVTHATIRRDGRYVSGNAATGSQGVMPDAVARRFFDQAEGIDKRLLYGGLAPGSILCNMDGRAGSGFAYTFFKAGGAETIADSRECGEVPAASLRGSWAPQYLLLRDLGAIVERVIGGG